MATGITRFTPGGQQQPLPAHTYALVRAYPRTGADLSNLLLDLITKLLVKMSRLSHCCQDSHGHVPMPYQ
jgi:hypothetical protein